MTTHQEKAVVSAFVKAPADIVWARWNEPDHITNWYFASPDWHAPRASNDLQPGGRLSIRMEAKDGSYGFDFEGTYAKVSWPDYLEYVLADGRVVSVSFEEKNGGVFITETFDLESTHTPDVQQQGWQQILDNFKKYCEETH